MKRHTSRWLSILGVGMVLAIAGCGGDVAGDDAAPLDERHARGPRDLESRVDVSLPDPRDEHGDALPSDPRDESQGTQQQHAFAGRRELHGDTVVTGHDSVAGEQSSSRRPPSLQLSSPIAPQDQDTQVYSRPSSYHSRHSFQLKRFSWSDVSMPVSPDSPASSPMSRRWSHHGHGSSIQANGSAQVSGYIESFLLHFLKAPDFSPFDMPGSAEAGGYDKSIDGTGPALSRRLRSSMLEVHAASVDCPDSCSHEFVEPWFTLFEASVRMERRGVQNKIRESLETATIELDGALVTPERFDELSHRDRWRAALLVMAGEISNNQDSFAWSLAAKLFPSDRLKRREHRPAVEWLSRMFDLRVDLAALAKDGAKAGQLDAFVQTAARCAQQDRGLENLALTLRALAAYEIVAGVRNFALSRNVGFALFHASETLRQLATEVLSADVQPGSTGIDYAERFNQLLLATKQAFVEELKGEDDRVLQGSGSAS